MKRFFKAIMLLTFFISLFTGFFLLIHKLLGKIEGCDRRRYITRFDNMNFY